MTGILGSSQALFSEILLGEAAELPTIVSVAGTDALGIEELNTYNKALYRSGSDTIVFTEKYFGEPHIVDGDDTLTISEDDDRSIYRQRGNSDTLTINESYGSANIYYRDGSDTITIVEKNFSTVVPPGGNRYTVLEGIRRAVVLPNPLFGDTEANGDSLSIFRTQTNRRVVTVKRQDMRTLNYQFLITRQKSIELREFIREEIDNKITLRNWKGEIWHGNITNNPFVLTATGRWGPCTERVEVELELKAVRIH